MFDNDIEITIFITTLLMLLLIAGVIITIFFANKRHIKQEVKMVQIQANYEKELRLVENEVQEQTLNNISRELHDNIGQLLTLMRIQIEQEKLDNQDAAAMLGPVDNTLTDTIQQVRLLSHSLNSDLLIQNGLLHMITQEAKRLQPYKSFTIHWDPDMPEPELTKDQRIMAFRIFQEVMNNIMKHAAARNIYIYLQVKEKFSITIKDDGRGFDLPDVMRNGKGAGIKNMVKRAALAKFHFHINSTPGKGSTFTLAETNI